MADLQAHKADDDDDDDNDLTLSCAAKKCSSQRFARNVADLQAHEADDYDDYDDNDDNDLTLFFNPVKKCGCQRVTRDVADLQAHKAGQEGAPLQSQDPPAKVPPRHICVRCFYTFEFLFKYMFKTEQISYCLKQKTSIFRLRKVKMDQRKLMDNANTITDMAKVDMMMVMMVMMMMNEPQNIHW